MNNYRIIAWVAACAVAAAFAGCRSAPTRIYTLEPTASASPIDAYHAPALRVDTLNVPAGWDRMEARRRLGRFRSTTSIIGLRRWPKWPGRPCPTIWIDGCRRAASFTRDCPSQSLGWASTSISWISTSPPRKPRCGRVGRSFPLGTCGARNAAPPHCTAP
jgi:hypothetical protein